MTGTLRFLLGVAEAWFGLMVLATLIGVTLGFLFPVARP